MLTQRIGAPFMSPESDDADTKAAIAMTLGVDLDDPQKEISPILGCSEAVHTLT